MLSIAINAQLQADSGVAAIISDRVYPEWAKEADKVYPLAVFKIENDAVLRAFDGPSGVKSGDAVIAAIGTTYAQAAELAEAITAALDSKLKVTWGGVYVQGCFLQDSGVDDEIVTIPISESLTVYVKELTFNVIYQT